MNGTIDNNVNHVSIESHAVQHLNLENDLDIRYFLALIKGVGRMVFYQDPDITTDYLIEQVFSKSSMDLESVQALIRNCGKILKNYAAYENWEPQQLREYLQQKTNLSEEHRKAFAHYWSQERDNVHAMLVRQSIFSRPTSASAADGAEEGSEDNKPAAAAAAAANTKAFDIRWRVDQLTQTASINEMSETVAIVEIAPNAATAATTTTESNNNKKLLFEVDRKTLARVLAQLNDINSLLSAEGVESVLL